MIFEEGRTVMVPTYSPEGRLLEALRKLGMNASQFIRVARAFDLPASQATLSEAFAGKRELNRWAAQRLIALTDELLTVKDFYKAQDINLNWGVNQAEAESVAVLIVKQRMAYGSESNEAK
jgi:hypothetical protein